MKSKDKNNNSHNKRKKKIREISSYKFQLNTKVKHKTNIDSRNKNKAKEKNKKYKYVYSNSKISAKSFNQKPKSSLIKEYNTLSKNNNFNAVSYSNIAFSDMEHIKKNENNILDESSKFNNDDNTLIQTNMTYSLSSNNNKMNINELNYTYKGKKDSIKSSKNCKKDIHDNTYAKRAAFSIMNENKKTSNHSMYNLSNKTIKNKIENSLKRFDDKSNNNINNKNFNESKLDKGLKSKKNLEQYMSNSRKSFYENEKNNNKEIINNKINKYNKAGSHVQDNISKINEENNSFNDSILPPNNHNNANRNNQKNKLDNYEQEMNINNFEDEFVEDGANLEFDGLEEKLQNLYNKIHGYKDEIPQLYPMEVNDDANYQNQNQITYPNLRRYQRQKSEPNLRIIPLDLDSTFNINNNINKDINNRITPPKLVVKYPEGGCDNKNLSKIKIMEEKLKNENITKTMINTLIKKQDNPALINILSKLQMTIKKLPKNENTKENNIISTLPANYLFPFDMYDQMKNIKSSSYFKITKNFGGKNKNAKAKEIKSKLKDFQEIINKTNKNKNYFNFAPRNKGFKSFYYCKSRKTFFNLCPVNYLENSIFNLEI